LPVPDSPGDEHRAGRPRDGLDQPEDLEHRLAAADDVVELVRVPSARLSSTFSCRSRRLSSRSRTFSFSSSTSNGLIR
jgi:hypothetical protein